MLDQRAFGTRAPGLANRPGVGRAEVVDAGKRGGLVIVGSVVTVHDVPFQCSAAGSVPAWLPLDVPTAQASVGEDADTALRPMWSASASALSTEGTTSHGEDLLPRIPSQVRLS